MDSLNFLDLLQHNFFQQISQGVDISANDLDGFSKRIHDEMDVKQKAQTKRMQDL